MFWLFWPRGTSGHILPDQGLHLHLLHWKVMVQKVINHRTTREVQELSLPGSWDSAKPRWLGLISLYSWAGWAQWFIAGSSEARRQLPRLWSKALPTCFPDGLLGTHPPKSCLRPTIHPWSPLPWPRLPWWLSGRESTCQCRRCGFNPGIRKIPWRRKWQAIPVLLPGESHAQRSLAGYNPWDHKSQTRLSN